MSVYAVASGKGGVGKTVTAANLAVALRMHDATVAVVDGDLAMPNLATVLGIDAGAATLHDVLAGTASVDDAIVEEADGFATLPGDTSLDAAAAIDPDRFGAVLETLDDRYDHVIVDTGAGVSYEDVLPLGLVDGVVLVVTPGRAAAGDARKTAALAERAGSAVRGVVVTWVGEGDDPDAIDDELGVDLLGAIPDDPAVAEAARAGAPLELHAPEAAAAAAYRRLAAALADEPAASTRGPETLDAIEGRDPTASR